MSPEQAQGLTTVDHRTDVYSLGAVLYEACAGAPAFPEMATYEQTIVRIVTRPAPRLASVVPDIHPELDRLCAEMLAQVPSARPRDMAAVRERLVQIFPEIERARLQVRGVADDVRIEAIGPLSNRVPAVTGPRARTPSSLAPAVVPQPALAPQEEPVGEVAPVPRRRIAARRSAFGALILAGAIGVLALGKAHRSAPPPPAPSFALAVSAVTIPQVTTADAPAPAAPAPEPEPAVPPPAATAASPAPAKSTNSAATRGATPARPATRRKAPARESSAPLVGGTTESTEF
jgi:serine/threonine-protein kinase